MPRGSKEKSRCWKIGSTTRLFSAVPDLFSKNRTAGRCDEGDAHVLHPLLRAVNNPRFFRWSFTGYLPHKTIHPTKPCRFSDLSTPIHMVNDSAKGWKYIRFRHEKPVLEYRVPFWASSKALKRKRRKQPGVLTDFPEMPFFLWTYAARLIVQPCLWFQGWFQIRRKQLIFWAIWATFANLVEPLGGEGGGFVRLFVARKMSGCSAKEIGQNWLAFEESGAFCYEDASGSRGCSDAALKNTQR